MSIYPVESERGPGQASASRQGALRVERFANPEQLGQMAAEAIAAALREILLRQSQARLVFASAPSQQETLSALARAPGIDWSRVVAFHMDEYIGLPADHPQSFGRWLTDHFFKRLPVGTVHLIKPGSDAVKEAERYSALLAEASIDIVCLGIGVNGHLAFNDPPVADFDDPRAVKVVTLDPVCRQQQVDEGCFASLDAVPREAVTLTIPRLLSAGQLFCMVPGHHKCAAVEAALYGPVSTDCPASVLRSHPRCVLYLDASSHPRALPDEETTLPGPTLR